MKELINWRVRCKSYKKDCQRGKKTMKDEGKKRMGRKETGHR
jgi:hypothetical protein